MTILPGIKGNFYLKNLPTIVESINELNKLGFKISPTELRVGIENIVENTGLKGRWQILKNKPMVITDVGHNEAGWQEILTQIGEMSHDNLHFVLGMVSDKDIDSIFNLLPLWANYYLCEPKIPRAMPVEQLAEEAKRRDFSYIVKTDVNECIDLAVAKAKESDLVFIGGSTFVVAEIQGL